MKELERGARAAQPAAPDRTGRFSRGLLPQGA